MTECVSNDLYKSLGFCQGKPVLPGIRRRVYYQKKSNIAKWPKLPELDAEGATMEKIATYEGDFILAADKKWLSLDVLTAKSDVSSEAQGEKPSVTVLNKANLLHSGTDEAATGFCRMALNDDLVFLSQQRNGKFRVIGNEAFETTVKPSQTTGQGDTGESGTTLEVSVTDVCPAPFYAGKIETEDGTISGADGSAVTDEA